MLVSQIRSTNPLSSILFIFLFWILNTVFELRELFLQFPNWNHFPLFEFFCAQLSILGISILLNKVLQKNKLVGVGDAFSGVLFQVFVLGLHSLHLYYKELIALFLISMAISRLINLYNAHKNYIKEFEIGILFGLSAAIAPGLLPVSIMMFVGTALVVPFSWRDFVVSLFGFIWVFFAKFSLFYIFEFSGNEVLPNLLFSISNVDFDFNISSLSILFICIVQLIIFMRIFLILEKRNIKERVFYRLWIWTLVFLFLSLMFSSINLNKAILIVYLGLPCAIFGSEFFPSKRKLKGYWKKEILLYTMVAIQIVIRMN
ncbi:MAG: hypothetical protein CMP67_00615 [Flavobacteriales bacterium]|nr:hypothetical protein [Flavobacteriales bacterium]|tara:strand:- start:2178 stop:3125 length:948 start_codon:yes stop_codon:yes gene_type:complete